MKEKIQEPGRKGLVKSVWSTIEKYRMILPGDRVIAGVSGGADSVCLLALLRAYGRQCPFELYAVHVEHGIRGEASLADARFVEKLCREWGIPCLVERTDVAARAAWTGQTLEEAGRQARYEIFEQCACRLGAGRIAVAHNRNDQAETVLLNLSRGSGVRGLGGIRPVRGRIIRPLLFTGRGEIEAWLKEQGISYCTDATNLKKDYTRNRLRLDILPRMEQEVNREAVKHLAECAAQLQRAEDYLQKQAGRLYEGWVRRTEDGLEIELAKFLEAEELMQEYVLRLCVSRILRQQGLKDYTAGHIRQMKELARMDCGKKMDFPGGLQAVRQNGVLRMRVRERTLAEGRAAAETAVVPLPASGIYEILGRRFLAEYGERKENMQVFPEKKYTKLLAYDTISHNVCLRTRRTGDYLIINQEGGRKKLKDYLIDEKIPREERDGILLLAEGSHILWVVGHRISEAAKITNETKKFLKIQRMEETV
ncbi:MAG: tRNA lysidine(34) synthetase TilS [Lachnospiraceae bacterium]|nr:tRNA lysidine(34) synthetase TilS [Lachnospiraceae bacterium]